jgi:hypothetical protein
MVQHKEGQEKKAKVSHKQEIIILMGRNRL